MGDRETAGMLQRRFLRHYGGRLALLAVWLQLALSFGHIHPGDIFYFGHPVTQGHAVTAIANPRDGAPPTPLQPGSGDAIDLTCAICANVALAAALVVPDPVRLPLPLDAVVASVLQDDGFILTAAPFLLFQTRAPPTV
jgi:hypothetical protein